MNAARCRLGECCAAWLCVLVATLVAAGARANSTTALPGNDPNATLSNTTTGWDVSLSDASQTYTVLAPTNVGIRDNGGGVGVLFLDPDEGEGGPVVFRNNGSIEDGVEFEDSGVMANNGVVRSSGGPALTMRPGTVADAYNSAFAILINGEAGTDPDNPPDYTGRGFESSNGTGVDLTGAYLVTNRAIIRGSGVGVFIDADEPFTLPSGGDGVPALDLSSIPELAGTQRITNLFNNLGDVEGGTTAIELTGSLEFADDVSLLPHTVVNEGLITGLTEVGVRIGAELVGADEVAEGTIINRDGAEIGGFASAIELVGPGEVTNEANALLISFEAPVVNFVNGEFASGTGTEAADFENRLTNSGAIEYGGGGALFAGRGADTFINNASGEVRQVATADITALTTVIGMGAGNDTVINRGSIEVIGDKTAIAMFTGADTLTNNGRIYSEGPSGVAVAMGGGDDVANLNAGSDITGLVDGGAGVDTVNLTGAGTLDGDLADFERMFVGVDGIDAGTDWQLLRPVDVGLIRILEGVLSVDDQVTVSPGEDVEISSAGTLSGGGSILGDVYNAGGRIAPGRPDSGAGGAVSDFGVLDIEGALDLESGSVIEIQFDGTSHDEIRVVGDANLTGTVQLIPVGTGVDDQTAIQFFSATGTLDEDLVANATALVEYILVRANEAPGIEDGELGFTFILHQISEFTSPAHQPLANLLDAEGGAATGELQDVLLAMTRLETGAEVDAAVGALGPETLGATPMVAFSMARQHALTWTSHLRDQRRERFPGDPLRSPGPDSIFGDWWMSFAAYGVFSDIDEHRGITGFDANGGGVALAFERQLRPLFDVGLSVGISYAHVSSTKYDTTSHIVTPRVSAFAGGEWQNLYLDGVASYGLNWVDSERAIDVAGYEAAADSDHLGHELSALLSAGYDHDFGYFALGPRVAAMYLAIWEDDYDESGSGTLNLSIDEEKTGFAQTLVGLRVTGELRPLGDVRVLPELHVDWAKEWLYEDKSLSARMAGLTGRFDVSTAFVGDEGILAGIGAKMHLDDQIVFELDYTADFGRDAFRSHNLRLLWTVEY